MMELTREVVMRGVLVYYTISYIISQINKLDGGNIILFLPKMRLAIPVAPVLLFPATTPG